MKIQYQPQNKILAKKITDPQFKFLLKGMRQPQWALTCLPRFAIWAGTGSAQKVSNLILIRFTVNRVDLKKKKSAHPKMGKPVAASPIAGRCG
jgi:hypothetical protein